MLGGDNQPNLFFRTIVTKEKKSFIILPSCVFFASAFILSNVLSNARTNFTRFFIYPPLISFLSHLSLFTYTTNTHILNLTRAHARTHTHTQPHFFPSLSHIKLSLSLSLIHTQSSFYLSHILSYSHTLFSSSGRNDNSRRKQAVS